MASMARINGGRAPQSPAASSNPRSEFSKRAADIAKDIADATSMLQRLAQLAKRKTLFDDRPVEITELTYVIKQKVSRINDAIAALQQFAKNSSKGSAWGSHGADNQINEHSRNVVVLLQGKLTEVTSGFAEVLETRTKNIQASKSRTQQFISSTSSAAASTSQLNSNSPLYGGGSGMSRHQTPVPAAGAGDSSGSVAVTESYAENPYGNSEYLALPEQQQALMQEQQDQYLAQRSSAVEAIESTIQELGGIFSQLATMVAEQRETVQRIDANTEDISINVSGAQRELLKYYARVSSNRWLLMKMFGIIIFFFFIWVLVS